ncbi:MAG TPA: pyrrolo-quinoline quinone [Myxococcota bacterium]|nr:pyrrolo-quinoline quinone [Myxococcota bacterium]
MLSCRFPVAPRLVGSFAAIALLAAGPALAAISVSLSPPNAAVTALQPQQFSAVVTGDPQNLGVTWSVDGIGGGNASAGTIDTTGLFTPGAVPGLHTVTATSVADATLSASVSVAVTDLAGVFMHHNDAQRTGVNAKEYALSPATVGPGSFGKLFSCALDGPGYVYAEPLYVAGLTMGDGKRHNVVFVATESDWVYAYDADAPSCQQLWSTRVLQPDETTVPAADTGELNDLVPEIGVTSTPVIDPSTNTIYVCAKSKDSGSDYHHRLYALDLIGGAPKLGSPIEITAPNFVPLYHLQRPALLLDGGTVYVAFGSHGDNNIYQGWVMAYDATSLAQKFAWPATDPTSGNNEGAIWGAGGGPAVDASGNVYVETANGTFDANTGGVNYGDSVVKLNPSGAVASYFTPSDQDTLNANDIDLGSGAVVVLPDALGSTGHPYLALASGKPGILYLLDRDSLGGFHHTDRAVQEIAVHPNTTDLLAGVWGQPAVWGGRLYIVAIGDPLRQYAIGNGAISTLPQTQSANTFPFRGATPAVSSNGSTNGVVWAVDVSAYPSGPAVLYAYDATDLTQQLYSSPASGALAAGNATKFTVPTVANGRVYVGGQASITVFGYLPEPDATLGLACGAALLASLSRRRLRRVSRSRKSAGCSATATRP